MSRSWFCFFALVTFASAILIAVPAAVASKSQGTSSQRSKSGAGEPRKLTCKQLHQAPGVIRPDGRFYPWYEVVAGARGFESSEGNLERFTRAHFRSDVIAKVEQITFEHVPKMKGAPIQIGDVYQLAAYVYSMGKRLLPTIPAITENPASSGAANEARSTQPANLAEEHQTAITAALGSIFESKAHALFKISPVERQKEVLSSIWELTMEAENALDETMALEEKVVASGAVDIPRTVVSGIKWNAKRREARLLLASALVSEIQLHGVFSHIDRFLKLAGDIGQNLIEPSRVRVMPVSDEGIYTNLYDGTPPDRFSRTMADRYEAELEAIDVILPGKVKGAIYNAFAQSPVVGLLDQSIALEKKPPQKRPQHMQAAVQRRENDTEGLLQLELIAAHQNVADTIGAMVDLFPVNMKVKQFDR